MLLNFPKIFKAKDSDSELAKKDIAEVNSLEQDSEGELYELPSVTDGQVNIHFTSIAPADGALLVGFFVTNGYSQKVKFKNVPLVLLDSERRVLAQQLFDGETIGDVAGGSTKACVVRFLPENIYTQNIPDDCQVCFDVRPKRPKQPRLIKPTQNIKIEYQTLPENISADQRQELEQILATLPPIKDGEANFAPLYAKTTDQNNLLATVIIRNSTNIPIIFEQLPLVIFDANQKEVAHGLFEVKSLTLEPFKAILWTFNFGNVLQDKDIDLSSWHIKVLD